MRWKCICAYDGTSFCGWQSQANGGSVQDAFEAQLATIFKRFIRIHGSSRTDTGVHARGQAFHFDADWQHGPIRLLHAINARLARTLKVLDITSVDEQFHARFSVLRKRYCYYFQMHPANPFEWRYLWDMPTKFFDLHQLDTAAQLFVGTHNFSGFSGKILPEENPNKTILQANVKKIGHGRFCLEVIGSGFLYRMVRMMMGTLMMLIDKKIDTAFISERLALQNLEKPIVTAPARGLFLENIYYE